MKIVTMQDLGLPPVTIRRLVEGYHQDNEGNIRCFNGKLNPRPSYQREFVYNDEDKQKVFKTLFRGFPLGTFYWCETEDGCYELIDGQQRTLSIIDIIVNDEVYLERDDNRYFWSSLHASQQDAILDQELLVYVCKGNPDEKTDWFETINIAGKPLTKQEIRSAVYSGPFVSDARKWFVAGGSASCQAVLNDFKRYVKGNVERQEVLEKVLYWHAAYEGHTGDKNHMIRDYLKKHKKDENADALWEYYDAVIRWADMLFDDRSHDYTSDQQKVEWGLLYNKYHGNTYEPKQVQKLVTKLMENPEILKKDGIYEYVFDGDARHLSPRKFREVDKRTKYEEQKHECAYCHYEIRDMSSAHADHIVPWSKGGRTEYGNLQILCVRCNQNKSNEEEAAAKKQFSLA